MANEANKASSVNETDDAAKARDGYETDEEDLADKVNDSDGAKEANEEANNPTIH